MLLCAVLRSCEGFHPLLPVPPSDFSCVMLRAKPSPKASFDLDAIEAFESQLEELEEQQQQQFVSEQDNGAVPINQLPSKTSSSDAQILVVPPELHNKRIDAAIAALLKPELSRSICGNLVAEGRVQRLSLDNAGNHDDEDIGNLPGEILDRKSFKVEEGMTLRVSLPQEEQPTEIVAQDLPLDILYEDEYMIVLNKAAHMVVHPAAGNWDGTVVNALAYYLPRSSHGRGDFIDADGKPIASASFSTSNNDYDNDDMATAAAQQTDALDGQSIDEKATLLLRPGIVHRLDKGTTGVLVVAKTARALTALSEKFANRHVSKTYLAITVGNPGNNVKIDKPIGRHPVHRQRMRVVPDPRQRNSQSRLVPPSRDQIAKRAPSVAGRRALSYVDSLAFDGKLSLVRVKIETGRTHQVSLYLPKLSIYFSPWDNCYTALLLSDICLLQFVIFLSHTYTLSLCHRYEYIYKIGTLLFTGTMSMVYRTGTNAYRIHIRSSGPFCTPTSSPFTILLLESQWNSLLLWIRI